MKDLNLLPEYIVNEQKGKRKKKLFHLFEAIAILSAVVLIALPVVQFFILKSQNTNAENKLKALVSVVNDADKYTKIKSEIDKKADLQKAVENHENWALDVMKSIEDTIPKRVTVLNLDASDQTNKITIKGYANDDLAVADFLSNLRKQSSFQEVMTGDLSNMFVGTGASQNSITSFTISLKYVPKEQ